MANSSKYPITFYVKKELGAFLVTSRLDQKWPQWEGASDSLKNRAQEMAQYYLAKAVPIVIAKIPLPNDKKRRFKAPHVAAPRYSRTWTQSNGWEKIEFTLVVIAEVDNSTVIWKVQIGNEVCQCDFGQLVEVTKDLAAKAFNQQFEKLDF